MLTGYSSGGHGLSILVAVIVCCRPSKPFLCAVPYAYITLITACAIEWTVTSLVLCNKTEGHPSPCITTVLDGLLSIHLCVHHGFRHYHPREYLHPVVQRNSDCISDSGIRMKLSGCLAVK